MDPYCPLSYFWGEVCPIPPPIADPYCRQTPRVGRPPDADLPRCRPPHVGQVTCDAWWEANPLWTECHTGVINQTGFMSELKQRCILETKHYPVCHLSGAVTQPDCDFFCTQLHTLIMIWVVHGYTPWLRSESYMVTHPDCDLSHTQLHILTMIWVVHGYTPWLWFESYMVTHPDCDLSRTQLHTLTVISSVNSYTPDYDLSRTLLHWLHTLTAIWAVHGYTPWLWFEPYTVTHPDGDLSRTRLHTLTVISGLISLTRRGDAVRNASVSAHCVSTSFAATEGAAEGLSGGRLSQCIRPLTF